MALPTLTDLNWMAVLAAAAWNFFLGFAWYASWSPTGKVWMREMKVPQDAKPAPAELARGLALTVVGALLTMAALAWILATMRMAAGQTLSLADALTAPLLAWVGFLLPILLGGMAWERKSGRLTAVNAGYHLVSLVVAAVILTSWT